jgi:hypothetical protein
LLYYQNTAQADNLHRSKEFGTTLALQLPLLCESSEEKPWREHLHGEHSACYVDSIAMQYHTEEKQSKSGMRQQDRRNFSILKKTLMRASTLLATNTKTNNSNYGDLA